MRFWLPFLLALAVAALPGRAEEPFTTGSFQIFGGIDDGGANARARRAKGPVPQHLRSEVIDFESALAPGSILVRTGERKLYFILPEGRAIAYHVGVGREGFTWSGTDRISRKAQWPDWRPPPEMIARERRKGRVLPAFVPGGPETRWVRAPSTSATPPSASMARASRGAWGRRFLLAASGCSTHRSSTSTSAWRSGPRWWWSSECSRSVQKKRIVSTG